jgi:tetratricopeptide (TPR) repeat protein
VQGPATRSGGAQIFKQDFGHSANPNENRGIVGLKIRRVGQLLAQAVTAYHAALEVNTRESLPAQWAQTHGNLALTYLALGQLPDTAQSLRNVLLVYPDSRGIYSNLAGIYHERLFDFQTALGLHQAWLERHPDDLPARADRAEAAFTVGRFAEAETWLEEVPRDAALSAGPRVALRALEVGDLAAQHKMDAVPTKLRELLDLVSAQPADFQVGWNWAGTEHFVQTDERLAPVRDWLLSLFQALRGMNRAAILDGIQKATERFATGSKP